MPLVLGLPTEQIVIFHKPGFTLLFYAPFIVGVIPVVVSLVSPSLLLMFKD